MPAARIPVRFEPAGATAWVDSGATVLEASAHAGIVLSAPCGGRGVCGACGVRVLEGSLEPPDDLEQVGLARATSGVRLACRARVHEPVTVQPLVIQRPQQVRASVAAGTRLAAAVDLGTTTVSACIIDAVTGAELGRGAAANRQQAWGADVVSRVSAAVEGAADRLRVAAEGSILDALAAACPAGACDLERVESLAIAGNSAMTGLLTDADLAGLTSHPYTLAGHGVMRLPEASAIRSGLAEGASISLVPLIGAWVGGDTTAALIAAGMLNAREPALLVDLGTNAEVALASERGVWVASAAAGPAFEAGGLECGGPATEGGVVSVGITADDLVLETLGSGPPLWLAGSGAISAIAALRKVGHIDAQGLMHADGPLASRFSRDEQGVLGIALTGPAGGGAACLRIDQRDVRAFQTAKAAVRVGIDMVLDAAHVRPRAVQRVLIAGAFGSALRSEDLVALGVLPRRLGAHARAVGDAALDGASIVAARPMMAVTAATRLADAHIVDLAADPRFNDRLLAALALEESE